MTCAFSSTHERTATRTNGVLHETGNRTKHAGKGLQSLHRPDNSPSPSGTTHDRLQDNQAFPQKIRHPPQLQHDLLKPESHGEEKMDKTHSNRRRKNLLRSTARTKNTGQHEPVHPRNPRHHKNHDGNPNNLKTHNTPEPHAPHFKQGGYSLFRAASQRQFTLWLTL
jgi:hypothetical protein